MWGAQRRTAPEQPAASATPTVGLGGPLRPAHPYGTGLRTGLQTRMARFGTGQHTCMAQASTLVWHRPAHPNGTVCGHMPSDVQCPSHTPRTVLPAQPVPTKRAWQAYLPRTRAPAHDKGTCPGQGHLPMTRAPVQDKGTCP